MTDPAFPGLRGYDPDNLQHWTVGVVTAMTVLATLSVVLRLVSRYLKGQSLWWDDYAIIFSLCWNYVVVGFIFAMYAEGMGIHADKVSTDKIVMMAKWLLVAEILYAWNLCWTKISLLLMYYRIFHIRFFKNMAFCIGGFVLCWGVTVTFLFVFICVPVAKLWYPDLPGHCIDQVGTWIANATSTILTDLAILVLPIPQIWKLQLRRAEKLALTVAFGLGSFVVAASAYRFSVLFSYSNSDPSYTLAPTVGWTAIEMSAGIISACLPTLRPTLVFVSKTLGLRLFSTRSGQSTNHSRGANQDSQGRVIKTNNSELLSASTHAQKQKAKDAFYRLDDGSNESPVDEGLRPAHGTKFTVATWRDSSGSADEIPLHSIRVQTDLKQTEHDD
ncbi:integral membrane protein [Grosmannia clavigera kw1407]|uniref:Integral membrane protein n=1 Tax=Grosmannia clavigera (strain kw1407 / UAMH 11150) TaxID=655863 RepID=F0X905_GROCL|nr:uncharacterized protein CMQ_3333 [Grosmannia clavigera kw1407]EFX05264.1 integral membrane protein [Grosmannia clavigera kw1407]